MPIKAFDAPTLRALRPEIDTALAPLGERHGITLRTGNGSYSGATRPTRSSSRRASAWATR